MPLVKKAFIFEHILEPGICTFLAENSVNFVYFVRQTLTYKFEHQ